MKRNNRKSRKIRLRRIFLLSVSLLLTFSCLVCCGGKGEKAKPEYIQYTVQSGDTLWDIARHYGTNKFDIRLIVHQIEEKNSLSGAAIYCGDELLVPVYACN